jgi:hypothetical protein
MPNGYSPYNFSSIPMIVQVPFDLSLKFEKHIDLDHSTAVQSIALLSTILSYFLIDTKLIPCEGFDLTHGDGYTKEARYQ